MRADPTVSSHCGKMLWCALALLTAATPLRGQGARARNLVERSASGRASIAPSARALTVMIVGLVHQSGEKIALSVTAPSSQGNAWLCHGATALRQCRSGRASGPVTLRDRSARAAGSDGGFFPRVFLHCGRARGGNWASLELSSDGEEGVSFRFTSPEAAERWLRRAASALHEKRSRAPSP
jgi:hypothetical protein